MDNFVKTLIEEVKSQGVFDEFRFNCCLADVDTKPAYQNVRNRVETAVNDFLAKQHWTPDTNKVQLRERLRKHLLDSDVLDKGVDHIVDQVVNPKVATIFEPKIESIAYKYLGIAPPPPPAHPPPRPPLLPAPPLPPYTGHAMGHMNGGNLLQVETTASLLPTDLEQISPDSDRATVKSDVKEDSKDEELPPGVDSEDILDDDDDDDATSPAFEPATSIKDDTNNASLTSDSVKDAKELAIDSRDAGASQTSQLSQVSSDSRLTIASTDAPQPTSANNSLELTSNIAANMSEEAQMPKFNENSSDANDNSGRQLHFDIKQDAITFEGTERRTSMSESNNDTTQALSIEDAIMCELKANVNAVTDAPIEPAPTTPLPETSKSAESPESSFAMFSDSTPSSLQPKDCSTVVPELPTQPPLPPLPTIAPPPPELPPLPTLPEKKQELTQTEEEDKAAETKAAEINLEETQTNGAKSDEAKPDEAKPDEAMADNENPEEVKTGGLKPEEVEAALTTLPMEPDEFKGEVNKSTEFSASPASASSSSQTKKHSSLSSRDKDKDKRQQSQSHSDDKPRRKSRDRERDKSRSKTSSSSKHSSSHTSSHSSSSKHRSSSSKNEKSSSSTTSSRSNHETSSSKRSSSRHDSSSSSNKKHKSSSSTSRSDRDRARSRESQSHHSRSHNGSGSSSSNSKRSDRDRDRDRNKSSSSSVSNSASNSITAVIQDDHNEVKAKLQKRHSNDSNDEGKPPGSSSRSPTETVDTQTKENATEPAAENGSTATETNGSNGTNGTNGTKDNETTDELVPASNVVILSDMLQQSTFSYIELSSAGPASKPAEDGTKAEEGEADLKLVETPEESSEIVPVSKSPEPVAATEIKTTPESPSPEDDQPNVPIMEAPTENESVEQVPGESNSDEDCIKPAKPPYTEEAVTAASDNSESQEPTQLDDSERTEETAEIITHFEQDADEFKARLLLIEQHIRDRRQLLSVLSAPEEKSCQRRSLTKRRLSSEPTSSKQHSSSSSSSSSSGSISGSPDKRAKRMRRDEAKTSPTPSEMSVNSKENEELEKHEKGDHSSRRLSQKLCQQQRYNNDDLYKPRPLLSQRSRRRGLDSIL